MAHHSKGWLLAFATNMSQPENLKNNLSYFASASVSKSKKVL
jgi:hypothetical protein